MEKEQVLFLSSGNSARSQMAKALLRKYAGDQFEVFSAGLEPSLIYPYTVKVLNEISMNAHKQYSKPLSMYAGKKHFDYLIAVCSNADERCPVFPGVGTYMHWPFEDPTAFNGSPEEMSEKFREI